MKLEKKTILMKAQKEILKNDPRDVNSGKILQEEIEDISSDAPEGKLTIVHLNALKKQAKLLKVLYVE